MAWLRVKVSRVPIGIPHNDGDIFFVNTAAMAYARAIEGQTVEWRLMNGEIYCGEVLMEFGAWPGAWALMA